jgi:hypothetical protein
MTETTKKTPAELEQEFYSKPLYISYSALNKLLFSPQLYYKHYVLQQREEQIESYLIDGKVIHCLLLNDGSFDENFILLPSTLPTGNSRLVIDKVFSQVDKTNPGLLSDHSQLIIDILKEINLHQSLKTDEQRVAKIVTEENISYYSFLLSRGNKDMIDSETLQRCNEAVDILKADPKVCQLLGIYRSEMENIDMINEIEFKGEADELNSPLGLKGIIDSIQVNHDEKVIYINDLKTTGKTISDFPETIEFYNYSIQAAIYNRLVKFAKKGIVSSDWKIVFHFIVIDKYQQVYCFQVSDDTMKLWDELLEEKLKEAHWHYKNHNYKLPFKFATSNVIL